MACVSTNVAACPRSPWVVAWSCVAVQQTHQAPLRLDCAGHQQDARKLACGIQHAESSTDVSWQWWLPKLNQPNHKQLQVWLHWELKLYVEVILHRTGATKKCMQLCTVCFNFWFYLEPPVMIAKRRGLSLFSFWMQLLQVHVMLPRHSALDCLAAQQHNHNITTTDFSPVAHSLQPLLQTETASPRQ